LSHSKVAVFHELDKTTSVKVIDSPSSLVQPNELRPEASVLFCCARTSYDPEVVDQLQSLIRRGIDWTYLLEAANQHGVTALLYQGLSAYCDDCVPAEIMAKLKVVCSANAQHNLYLTRALLALLASFEAHAVSAVPYKGPILAAMAYRNLSLRQFCDLDILVRQKDVLTAIDVLNANGYQMELPSGQSTPIAQLIDSKKDFRFVSADRRVVVELHWRLAGKHFYFPYNLDQVWQRLDKISFSGTPVLNISPEDLLVILCAHGSKHLWGRLLWICDIGELIRSNATLDWQQIMRSARKSGSQRMVLLGLYLAKTLLGTAIPNDVARAIQTDRAVGLLAQELLLGAFPSDAAMIGRLTNYSHALYPFFIRMRERPWDKVKLALHYSKLNLSAAVTPNLGDREYFALPSSISFLYYVLHPFRVIGRYAQSHWHRR
jgi:hypothetical protein